MISIVIKLISLVSLTFVLTACEPEPKDIVTVGTNIWPGYQTLYLARSLGAFKGQPVKLIEMPSSTETALAFRNGTLDVAGLTLDEVLTLLQYDASLKVILVMDMSMGADALLAKPEIDRLEKLKGKRIGVENMAVGAILLQGALQAANLNVADIDLRSITFDRHETSFSAGLIDAIVTFEPVKSKLLVSGARQLFDSSRIPGHIVDVLVTRQTVIDRYPDTLNAIAAGHFQALSYLREHPENAAARIGPNMGVEPAQVFEQFKGMELPGLASTRQWLNGKNPKLNASIDALAELMLEQGLLFKPVDTSRLVDASLLPLSQDQDL